MSAGTTSELTAKTALEEHSMATSTSPHRRPEHLVQSVGVIGSSGAVGMEIIDVLNRRAFKCRSLRLFARRAAGEVVDCGRFGKVTVEPFSVAAAQECALVLLAVSGSFATKFAREISGGPNNTVVIDNSSAFRYKPEVPLVIPEINGRKSLGERVIANPNCTTAIAAMALWPIHQKYRLRKVIISTYQAASGAGAEGMAELKEGVATYTKTGVVPAPKVFQHPLAFNVIPHIDVFQENGYTKEEMKVAWELRKIFDLPPNVKVSCTAVRVPTLRAHSESIVLETEFPIDPDDVRALLRTAPGVELMDDPANLLYPLPARASGKDSVEVGRIRRSLIFGEYGIELFVAGDQLLRGAALNAVLIAERVMLSHYTLANPSEYADEEDNFPLIGAIPWQVHKFGGAALASAERYKLCAERLIAEHRAGSNGWMQPIAAVLSATEGMTDKLIDVSSVAAKGNPVEAIKQLTAVIDLQREIARALLPADHPELIVLESTFSCDSVKLASVLQTLSLLRGAADEACGYICGMGELWSSRTLTAVLIAMGATACMLDAREVLTVADGGTARLGVKGAAMDMATDVLYEISARKLETWWDERSVAMFPTAEKPGPILVITGFIASTKSGSPTTLKRSGSDFSATIFARLLKAKQVTLWKTVDGVYTADPRMCKAAFPVPFLSYDEAIELAYFGGQVLHPLAMKPCIDDKITLVVRNILNVAFVGTMILPKDQMEEHTAIGVNALSPSDKLIRAPLGAVKVVTSIASVAMIEVKAGGSDSVAEVTRRVMDVMHREGIQVIMITQASSEHSVSVAVDKSVGHSALAALKRNYEHELVENKIDGVSMCSNFSLLSVIGPMRGMKGTLAKVTRGISAVNANIYAAAQGSSERSISMVVEAKMIADVVNSVHEEFLGQTNLGLVFKTSVGGM